MGTMPSSKEMDDLCSQTAPVDFYFGWLQDQTWQGGQCQGCPLPCQCDLQFLQCLGEESTDLLVLDNKQISCQSSVEAVGNVRKIGEQQFQAFTQVRLIKRLKLIDDVIHSNNLK